MKPIFRAVSLLTVLVVGALPSLSQARAILFSNTIPSQQIVALKADLNNDLSLAPTEDAQRVLGLQDLSDTSLKNWLTSRVGFIVGETEDLSERVTSLGNYSYQNSGIFPDFETPKPATGNFRAQAPSSTGAPQILTVMANVGTAIYYFGKHKNLLTGYNFTSAYGNKVIAMRSPRAGIIKIGEGLFAIKLDKANDASIANTWFRMSTFFHEAHHSDGNAKSLGFPHAICPEGHEYAGHNACDRNGNGPYSVDAQLLKQARATCVGKQNCSAREAELLAIASLDSFSRVLATTYWDPAPEGL